MEKKKLFNFLLIIISVLFGFFIFFLVFFNLINYDPEIRVGALFLTSIYFGFMAGGFTYCIPRLLGRSKAKKEEEKNNKKKWTDNY